MATISRSRRRKVTLSENVSQWADETGDLSRLVNQALIHYKYSLSNSIPSLERRFNPSELKVIKDTFDHYMTPIPMYFSDLNQFKLILHDIDQRKLNRSGDWKTAYRILLEHTPLNEINAIVFLTKFERKNEVFSRQQKSLDSKNRTGEVK